MNARKQPLTTEYALLGFLHKHPMHGYEIMQRIQTAHDDGLVWQVKQGMLYAVLARLERDGLLASTVESQGARPQRRLFSLTADGDARFSAWLQTPVRNGRDFRVEFLTKLYFAAQISNAAALTLIGQQIAASEIQIHRIGAAANEACASESFAGLVVDFRIGQIGAVLAWLRQCESFFANRHAQEERTR